MISKFPRCWAHIARRVNLLTALTKSGIIDGSPTIVASRQRDGRMFLRQGASSSGNGSSRAGFSKTAGQLTRVPRFLAPIVEVVNPIHRVLVRGIIIDSPTIRAAHELNGKIFLRAGHFPAGAGAQPAAVTTAFRILDDGGYRLLDDGGKRKIS